MSAKNHSDTKVSINANSIHATELIAAAATNGQSLTPRITRPMGRVTRRNNQPPNSMAKKLKQPQSDSSAPSGRVHPSCSPSTLRIKLEGREYTMPRKAYAIKKTAQLREFGYPSLTVDALEEQIDALMADKKLGDGLTVIGMFMEGEVLSKANDKLTRAVGD